MKLVKLAHIESGPDSKLEPSENIDLSNFTQNSLIFLLYVIAVSEVFLNSFCAIFMGFLKLEISEKIMFF